MTTIDPKPPTRITPYMNNFENYLTAKSTLVEERLDKILPPTSDYPEILYKALRHSVFSGGKRFRPVLTIAASEACGGTWETALDTAAAIELIHTYSLIHDDLPALDNADTRRGKPSSHKAFGENMAILAGDALLTLAFEIMSPMVVKDIARASGMRGMIGGQIADLRKNQHQMTVADCEFIHKYKTGSLIAVSAKAGAVLANAGEPVIGKIEKYGENIGLAFQIIDDVFDEEDYAALLGKEKARRKARELIDEAKKQISDLGPQARMLGALADFVVDRKF